jgi:hypothetical protein
MRAPRVLMVRQVLAVGRAVLGGRGTGEAWGRMAPEEERSSFLGIKMLLAVTKLLANRWNTSTGDLNA